MVINGNVKVKVEIDLTDQELGRAIMGRAFELAGVDDPGVDYYTDDNDNVYMADWCLGYNPRLAAMVDTANYLIYGKRLAAGAQVRAGVKK